MEMTIQEVKQLDKDSYQIIDIRDDNEIAHGAIPGAVALKVEEIAESPLLDKKQETGDLLQQRKIQPGSGTGTDRKRI